MRRASMGAVRPAPRSICTAKVVEFNFSYSKRMALVHNDADRADVLLKGIIGKRLTYQTVGAA